MEKVIDRSAASPRFLWISLATAVFTLALGVYGFFASEPFIVSMQNWFMTAFLVCGILDIVFWFFNRKSMEGQGLTMIFGCFEIILAALLVFFSPAKLAGSMDLIVGGWILLRSLWMILQYFKIRRETHGTLFLAITSIAGLLFGALYLLLPSATPVYLCVAILCYSVFRVIYWLKLRNLYAAE